MAGGTQALAILQAYVDADGALVVSASSSSTGVVLSIAGTANQVFVNGGIVPVGGAVTLSIPSDFRVAASGVFGSTSFAPMGEIAALSTTSSLPRGISNFQINTGTDSANFSAYKARGVPGTETIVVSGDILANFRGWGYDGAAYLNMASIRYVSAGTIALNRVPTQIDFYTATDAAPSVLTLALTLNKAQQTVWPAGTAGVPPLTLGDLTTGWYRRSANEWNFSFAGTERYRLGSNFEFGGPIVIGNTTIGFASGVGATPDAVVSRIGAGILMVSNAAGTGFTRLIFGTNDAAGAALKKNGVNLDVIDGNDGNFTSMRMFGLTVTGATITVPGAALALVTSSATFTSGAGASLGTLTNAPAAGNPTSWIKIVDNGVNRFIPAW